MAKGNINFSYVLLFENKNSESRNPNIVLPRFLHSYYSHYLLAKDYSENHNVLSKSHKRDLELHTIFFNIDHSEFIKLPFGRYDLDLKLLASNIP